MAKIRFKNDQVEDYTIILCNRNHQHYGQLTGIKGVTHNANLNSANEMSFTIYKHKLMPEDNVPYKDIESFQDYIWNNLIDLKLIYVKELGELDDDDNPRGEYYQIKVSVDDANDTIKTITATSQCEAELSQLNLYGIEINTENDIARKDYQATTFYNDENPDASLLHRILKDKAPHYTIAHVDKSLCELQRTFSIDGTSIYDFMIGECSEQFNCLFQFDSVDRTISVYDLAYFGKDTAIYVDKNNLTDSIHLEVNSDSIKNCFKLEGGDESMTAAIRALNPTGSDYIYIQRPEDLAEMPQALIDKLDEYYGEEGLYNQNIDSYRELSQKIYDLTDDILYYESSMMPYVEDIPSSSTITATSEAAKLTAEVLSPVALSKITKGTSIATVNSALLNCARVFVKSGYVKVEIAKKDEDEIDPTFYPAIYDEGEHKGELKVDENGYHYGEWHGRFKVTNYSDKEQVAYTDIMKIAVTDNEEAFMTQRIIKDIHSNDDDDGSVFNVLTIDDLEQFKCALKLYSLNRLISFRDALQSALDVLIQANQADANEEDSSLYQKLYIPYYNKLNACQDELDIRQSKIDELEAEKEDLQASQTEIHKKLDLETHLGDLYPIFCSYRREDKYSNSNYISDGLDNAKILERAKEFWEMAQKDLEKSSSGECTITSTLNNLLVIPEFKTLVKSFELGNWIRVRVDGQLYKLKLIGYSINFDNLQTIDVTFSTVTKVQGSKTEVENILESAKTMATGFSTVSKQAEKGQEANNSINSIVQNGLNSGLVQIKNNDNEEVTYGKHGLLCRTYDDIIDDYDPKQLKLTHNTIAFTDNNWKNVKTAIGEHNYTSYNVQDNKWEELTDYGLTTHFVTSGVIYGENQIIGGLIYSKNYSDGNTLDKDGNLIAKGGSMINLNTGEFSFGGDSLYYKYDDVDDEYKFVISDTVIGKSLETVDIKAENLHIDAGNIDGKLTASQIDTVGLVAENISATKIEGKNIYGGSLLIESESNDTYAEITEDGVLNCKGAEFSGNIKGAIIEGSEFITSSENDYEHLAIKDGNITLYDEYGVSWLSTYNQILSFKQPLYDENNNPYYSSTQVVGMRTCYHDPYNKYENSPAFSFNIGLNYPNISCLTVGYGNPYSDISMSNVLFAINYKGDSAIDICGTARTADIICNGNFSVSGGTKSRLATTENYNDRLLYCYEMPSPMFGDIGEGQIDETGKCYIFLDDIFAETIDTDCTYQVFLQPYGKGECYVTERTSSYFVVEGTENLSFGWEMKSIQRDFDTIRLEEPQEKETTQDYANETYDYLINSMEV